MILLSEKERKLFPGSRFVKFRPLNADTSRTTLQLICISSYTKNVNINPSAGSVGMSPILAEKRSRQHSQERTAVRLSKEAQAASSSSRGVHWGLGLCSPSADRAKRQGSRGMEGRGQCVGGCSRQGSSTPSPFGRQKVGIIIHAARGHHASRTMKKRSSCGYLTRSRAS